MQGNVYQVEETLFGSESEAKYSQDDGGLPGEAGRSLPTLLYLFWLETLNTELFQKIHRLIERREYVDALGNRWTVSENLWLLGSLIMPHTSATVYPEHWLCSAFHRRFHIEFPDDINDILLVACNMAEEFERNLSSEASMRDFIPAVRDIYDHFHKY